MTAFGYQPTDVRLTAMVQEGGRLRARFSAARQGQEFLFDICADAAKVVLESAAPQDVAGWPDLFHRLASLGPAGPYVSVALNAEGSADPDHEIWPAVDAVASTEERDALKSLLGFAEHALSNSGRSSGSPIEPFLVATLRAQAILVEPEDDDEIEAGAQGAKPVSGALEAFRNVVEEYYTSPEWAHIRLQLDDVRIAGVRHDMVTFKLFRTPAAAGLEFRPLLETGEHPFRTFPGTTRDNFGPYYRIIMDRTSGSVTLPEAETLTTEDTALIQGLIGALAPTMRAATIGVGHLDEKTYTSWNAVGASFQAAYVAAHPSGT